MLRAVADRYRRAFSGLPRDAWALAAILFINMSGIMVIFYLSLYLTGERGYSVIRAGQVLTGYGAGMLFGTLTGGWLTDRIGSRPTQKLSLFGAGISLIVLGFCRGFPEILAFVFLYGFFAAALYPANTAAVVEVCPDEVRIRGFVLNRLAANLGATIGPVVGGILARSDYRLLFWVDGATSLAAGAAFFVLLPGRRPAAPKAAEDRPAPGPAWWRDGGLWMILACTLGISLIFNQFLGVYSLYMRSAYGLTESRIGLLFAVNTILIVAFQMVLTHGLESWRRSRTAALGAVFLGLGFGLIPLGRSWAYAAATTVVLTVGEMLIMPTLTTMISFRAPAGRQGKYQGIFSLTYAVGSVFGPALGTRVYSSFGGPAVWFGVAGLGAAVALGFFLMKRERTAPA